MKFEDCLEFHLRDGNGTICLLDAPIATVEQSKMGKAILKLLGQNGEIVEEKEVYWPLYNYEEAAQVIVNILEEHVKNNRNDL